MKKSKFDFKRLAMKAVGVGAGAVGGEILNKPLANMNPMLRGGLKIAAGAILPEVIPMKDKSMVENIGSGIIASGAIDLYNQVAVKGIAGDDLDQFNDDDYIIEGIEESPINGVDNGPIQGIGENAEIILE